jgi:dihydrofolate reductase
MVNRLGRANLPSADGSRRESAVKSDFRSKSLPNRRNVVLTSRQIPGVETYASLEQALQAVKDEEKVFVIGGGRVFARFLALSDELYLTLVEENVEGDTYFPLTNIL